MSGLNRSGKAKGTKNHKTIAREFRAKAEIVAVMTGLASERVTKMRPLDIILALMHSAIAAGDLKQGGEWATIALPYTAARVSAVPGEADIPPELQADATNAPPEVGDEEGPPDGVIE